MDIDQKRQDVEEQSPEVICMSDCTTDGERKGPKMDAPGFGTTLLALDSACKAVIACEGQLKIMEIERGDGNYSDTLARGAKAIRSALEKGEMKLFNPAKFFARVSKILKEEIGNCVEGRMYTLLFGSIAEGFLKFRDEELFADMWLTVLAHVVETLSKSCERPREETIMLDALIRTEHKMKETMDLGLNHVKAFGEAVSANETFAAQTVRVPGSAFVNPTNQKTYKYPDPRLHAICVWMRATYEFVKDTYGAFYDYMGK